jgi:hypothetical protein
MVGSRAVADTDSPIKAAYDEAVRVIGVQAASLDALRSRASTVIATASLVTTFLGGQVLAKPTISNGTVIVPTLTGWGWAAVAALCGIGMSVIAVMWPYRWVWSQRADALIGLYEAPPATHMTLVDAQRDLALHLQRSYDSNEVRLARLGWVFKLSLVLLVAECIFWIIDLRGG